MTTPALTIYDDGLGRMGPLTHLRPVFEILSGAAGSRARIQRVLGQAARSLWVPDRLIELTRGRNAGVGVNTGLPGPGPCLLVNGRWSGRCLTEQINRLEPNQALVQPDGQVIAVCFTADQAEGFLRCGRNVLPDQVKTLRIQHRVLFERPWHILDELEDNLRGDLDASDLAPARSEDYPGVTFLGSHTVRVGQGARLMPSVVVDCEHGPVMIDHHAEVNPLVVLQGPCYIGPHSVLVSHTSIRRHTVIAGNCKVGGEISASVIHSHTNKAHAGYLGHSLVGSWTNLGADTNISNLKNTYGNIRVQLDPDRPAEDTGRQFHGAIIGDFVRTAIGSRLPTGAVVHTGCMLAVSGWAPKLATALGFYMDRGRQPYDIEKLIDTVNAMMNRRDTCLDPAEEDLLRQLASAPG